MQFFVHFKHLFVQFITVDIHTPLNNRFDEFIKRTDMLIKYISSPAIADMGSVWETKNIVL